MRKVLMAGLFVAAALAWTSTAYAHDANTWCNFWDSVGGFLYNALPWNWGNWAGK